MEGLTVNPQEVVVLVEEEVLEKEVYLRQEVRDHKEVEVETEDQETVLLLLGVVVDFHSKDKPLLHQKQEMVEMDTMHLFL